eukprot:scaffold2238_cov396-Prasinococcus_capsulatus_cf.AAC.1
MACALQDTGSSSETRPDAVPGNRQCPLTQRATPGYALGRPHYRREGSSNGHTLVCGAPRGRGCPGAPDMRGACGPCVAASHRRCVLSPPLRSGTATGQLHSLLEVSGDYAAGAEGAAQFLRQPRDPRPALHPGLRGQRATLPSLRQRLASISTRRRDRGPGRPNTPSCALRQSDLSASSRLLGGVVLHRLASASEPGTGPSPLTWPRTQGGVRSSSGSRSRPS